MNGNGDPGVTYTVKELIGMLEKTLSDQLSQISARLDVIDRRLDATSSNTRAEATEKRLNAVEERVSKVELASAGVAAVTKFQRWLVGAAAAVVSTSAAILVWISASGGQHP